MKNIVIGVTGSIACFKVIKLVKKLRKAGFNINVILTKNAEKLISKEEFEKASNNKVATELFNNKINYKEYLNNTEKIKHLSLAEKADLLVIAPATANILGKIAYGIADDLLTTTVMATKATKMICPAMNEKMYTNPIVQENIKKLIKLEYRFIGPAEGRLACGAGLGRLENINKIYDEITKYFEQKNSLKGKKILVTAGATAEEIDPVRIITNKSSGKMGIYLAEEAYKRGADVTLIRGSTLIEPGYNIKDIKINNAKELYSAIKKNIKDKNIMIHAAAVSDFKINKKDKKIKSKKELNLELTPTTKILERIKSLNKNIFLVGFKAEYKVNKNILVNRSYKKLKEAKADLIIANDVGKANRGFNVDTNEVFIINKNKRIKHLALANKRVIAEKILDFMA